MRTSWKSKHYMAFLITIFSFLISGIFNQNVKPTEKKFTLTIVPT